MCCIAVLGSKGETGTNEGTADEAREGTKEEGTRAGCQGQEAILPQEV